MLIRVLFPESCDADSDTLYSVNRGALRVEVDAIIQEAEASWIESSAQFLKQPAEVLSSW